MQVPTRGKWCRFGPVSQSNILASPLCAETANHAAAIAAECQDLANQRQLPVILVTEHFRYPTARHTFKPEIPTHDKVTKTRKSPHQSRATSR